MSDVAQNALRYNSTNTTRSDTANFHNGQEIGQQENGGVMIGFDCSGFVCHVILESGYRIDYEPTGGLSGSNAFTTVSDGADPGDIILFNGHVGIVIEYDSASALGKFIHMSGDRKRGGVIKISYFVTDVNKYSEVSRQHKDKAPRGPDKMTIIYGTSRPITALRRVNSNRYSANVDLHINGSNANPILRPLGTRIYSKHILKAQKKSPKRVSRIKAQQPNPIQTKRKSIPPSAGYVNLIRRIWGKFN
jgi:hypothetical protein